MEINKEQLEDMLHSLGIEYTSKNIKVEPKKRHNPLPVSCRNYYQQKNNESWNKLVSLGYAEYRKGENEWQCFYFVTQKGKQYLKELGYKWKEKYDK